MQTSKPKPFFFGCSFVFSETDWKVARIHQLAFDTATEETKPYVSREISGLAGACYRQAGPILGERLRTGGNGWVVMSYLLWWCK